MVGDVANLACHYFTEAPLVSIDLCAEQHQGSEAADVPLEGLEGRAMHTKNLQSMANILRSPLWTRAACSLLKSIHRRTNI